jgi:hypothetical protein
MIAWNGSRELRARSEALPYLRNTTCPHRF